MEIDLESEVNVNSRLGIRGVKARPIRLVTDSVDSKRRLIKAVDKLKDDNADVDTCNMLSSHLTTRNGNEI